jgi:hypothetical protein
MDNFQFTIIIINNIGIRSFVINIAQHQQHFQTNPIIVLLILLNFFYSEFIKKILYAITKYLTNIFIQN